jgi:RimJ/RimL family protein N-acetyltransferase
MIRLLREEDVEDWLALRREALLDAPLAFVSSPEDSFALDAEAMREQLRRTPESVVLGAFDEHLVGSVGLHRDRHRKASHKAHIWGMYVTPSQRRRGHAAQLLAAVLHRAAALPGIAWVHLSVSSAAPEARRLYEAAGFRAWGTEPEALRHAGRAASETHRVLSLETPDTAGA